MVRVPHHDPELVDGSKGQGLRPNLLILHNLCPPTVGVGLGVLLVLPIFDIGTHTYSHKASPTHWQIFSFDVRLRRGTEMFPQGKPGQ